MLRLVSLGVVVVFLVGCDDTGGSTAPADMRVVADLAQGIDLAVPPIGDHWMLCGTAHDGGEAMPPPDLAAPSTGPTQAPNFRIDAEHTGAQPGEQLTPPLTQAWALEVGQFVNYALVAKGRVFVTSGGGWPAPGIIVAADTQTGAVVWGPQQLGTDGLLAAYENDRVFALGGQGLLTALDAATGATLWATQLTDNSFFKTPPVTSDGLVFVESEGAGGILYAVDEVTGAVLWREQTLDGSDGTVAVSNGIVYDAESCAQVYAFAAKSGDILWHHCTNCSGGGGSAPTAYRGLLYVRADGFIKQNSVLDRFTGAEVGTLELPKADAPFSIQNGTAYLLNTVNDTGEVRAIDLASGAESWSVGNINIIGSPMVAGGYVYVPMSGKMLEAVDVTNGQIVWTTGVADFINSDFETASMTVAEGTLLVPAGDKLLAFR